MPGGTNGNFLDDAISFEFLHDGFFGENRCHRDVTDNNRAGLSIGFNGSGVVVKEFGGFRCFRSRFEIHVIIIKESRMVFFVFDKDDDQTRGAVAMKDNLAKGFKLVDAVVSYTT